MSEPEGPVEPTQLLTEADVAELLRVPVSAVRRWRAEGKGPHYFSLPSVRGGVRYDPRDVERYIDFVRNGPDE